MAALVVLVAVAQVDLVALVVGTNTNMFESSSTAPVNILAALLEYRKERCVVEL
jgi:hypothetical protein